MCSWKMIKFFKKIKNIFIGNFNRFFGKELTKEVQKRLQICMECEDKIRITKNEYVCKHCGCPIKSKSFVLDEECFLKKW